MWPRQWAFPSCPSSSREAEAQQETKVSEEASKTMNEKENLSWGFTFFALSHADVKCVTLELFLDRRASWKFSTFLYPSLHT